MRRLLDIPVRLAADACYAASLWLDTAHNMLTGEAWD